MAAAAPPPRGPWSGLERERAESVKNFVEQTKTSKKRTSIAFHKSDDPLDAEAGAYSGAVKLTKKSMRVPCAGGTWLEVTEVQPPGKKAMDASSYANGLKGSVLKVLHE